MLFHYVEVGVTLALVHGTYRLCRVTIRSLPKQERETLHFGRRAVYCALVVLHVRRPYVERHAVRG